MVDGCQPSVPMSPGRSFLLLPFYLVLNGPFAPHQRRLAAEAGARSILFSRRRPIKEHWKKLVKYNHGSLKCDSQCNAFERHWLKYRRGYFEKRSQQYLKSYLVSFLFFWVFWKDQAHLQLPVAPCHWLSQQPGPPAIGCKANLIII